MIYLLDIFENYSESSAIEETLYLLTKIYMSLDEYELAKKYASILAYNFPESRWYRKSYNHLNNLNDIIEDKKWYEKFNPIKIFRQKEEIFSDNISIQSLE